MREKTREIACLISGFTSERESVCDREIERERERKKEEDNVKWTQKSSEAKLAETVD